MRHSRAARDLGVLGSASSQALGLLPNSVDHPRGEGASFLVPGLSSQALLFPPTKCMRTQEV